MLVVSLGVFISPMSIISMPSRELVNLVWIHMYHGGSSAYLDPGANPSTPEHQATASTPYLGPPLKCSPILASTFPRMMMIVNRSDRQSPHRDQLRISSPTTPSHHSRSWLKAAKLINNAW